MEDFTMAEISKLSVGQALDKLRGTDAPSSKMTQLDGKIDEIDKELQLLRATSRRVERDQRAASAGTEATSAVPMRGARLAIRLGILGMLIGIGVVILVVAWKWLS
jgi:hypothetical protein